MTIEQIRKLTDDELYSLSLAKDKLGRYTDNANLAYTERQRRSGYIHYDGVSSNCSKYQADLDYYGDDEEWW